MSATQKAQNAASEAKDAVRIAADKAGDNARQVADRAAENTRQAAENTRQAADRAAENTRQAADKAVENTRQAADKAAENTRRAADKAADKAEEVKTDLVQALKDDGVEDPAGLATAAYGALFFAAIPVTSWVSQPNGLLEKAVNGLAHSVAWLGTAGSSSRVGQTGKIAALSSLYIAVTYALSGANSAAGVAAGVKGGRDNKHPRAQTSQLRGLPLRLYSAHYNLMEMFPGFALTAALAQATAPTDQTLINLLGLHVIAKVFVYYPAYLANIGTTRTLAHILATASVINVGLKLAKGALI